MKNLKNRLLKIILMIVITLLISSCTTQPKKESVVVIPLVDFPAVPDLPYDTYRNIYNEDGTIKEKVIPYDDWREIIFFMISTEEAASALYQNPT